MDYDKMLKEAEDLLPKNTDGSGRFEIPKVRGQLEGNKTIINNFSQVADALGRDPEHLLKYVLRELATPGQFRKQAVILGSRIPAARINEKINSYAGEFVFCKVCGKPDTTMTKESDIYYFTCQVCGAKYNFQSKI